MNEWKKAWRLLRDASAGGADSGAVANARAFLASCSDPHLAKLASLLIPPVSDKQLLCALVPVERRASRERLSDADLGISTADNSAFSPQPSAFVGVIADNLRSALNIGGIFRTCAFFGVSKLWLCGYTATPDNPHVAHSAMGAENIVPYDRLSSLSVHEAIHSARSSSCAVYALETARDAIDISTFSPPPDRPLAIVVGNERFGLDPETIALCDGVLAIRGAGAKNSLNVVSALAIALFQCGKRGC